MRLLWHRLSYGIQSGDSCSPEGSLLLHFFCLCRISQFTTITILFEGFEGHVIRSRDDSFNTFASGISFSDLPTWTFPRAQTTRQAMTMSFLCDPGQKPDRDPEGQAKNL